MLIAAAQMGPTSKNDSRQQVVARLCDLLKAAKHRGAELVVFPELAFTTFFPRWDFKDRAEVDHWFEDSVPSPETQPFFDLAKQLELGFSISYGERSDEEAEVKYFNTMITVDRTGKVLGKYRKVHVPGHAEFEDFRTFQHLEKKYFAVGNLGFPVFEYEGIPTGMLLCNDRRWPEAWRSLGLRNAHLVCVGYNTTANNDEAPQQAYLMPFQHRLSMQAGCYQNGCWGVASGKVGIEDGASLINQSCIVAPTGEIVALAVSFEDEVIVADCDFARCAEIKENMFNFKKHRHPELYVTE